MRYVSLLALGTVVIPSAFAIEPIPKESGVSGFVNIGAGVTSVESNSLAKFGSADIGNATLDSLDQTADTRTVGIPVIGLELAYTFADTSTQIFFGNQLEDYIRFDFSARAGIRQEIGKAGIIGASFLQTPLPTEVWEDPFLTGSDRSKTDRTSDGYRLIWDNIYGSGLELRYSAREVDIDRERSGESLGLSDSELALLNRNGDSSRFTAQYTVSYDRMKHIVTPAVAYFEQDSDGNAMAYDGMSFSVNYIYRMDNRWRFVTNASFGFIEFNEENPVFDTKADGDRFGVSFTAFYAQPFGWKGWLANAGVVWFEEDSDVNFYDSSVSLLSAGLLYRF